MNEEQGKPSDKWHKRIIIQWFFAVLALCIVSFVIYSAIGAQYWTDGDGYLSTKDDILDAVQVYQEENAGEFPVINNTYTTDNCTSCYILNMSSLLISNRGILRKVPTGVWQGNDFNDDNCDGGCNGCRNTNHYVWIISENGSVYSTCIGEDCAANSEDGYQEVWP